MNPDDEEKFLKQIKAVDQIAGKIKGIYKKTGKNFGKARCPICDGVINWRIVEFNKHSMGACQTAECLQWRE